MAQANCVPNVAVTNHDPIYTEQQAAEYLRISLPTLRRKRKAGTGPKHKQDGHIIRYRRSWLDAWLNGQPVQAE
jgi:excisionase family DNA binding protein